MVSEKKKKTKDSRVTAVRQGIIPYEDDQFSVGFDADGALGYAHVVGENIFPEVDAKDVSLSSFKNNDELNPKIWYNGKLNSRVRLRLLDIADDFIDFLDIHWVKPLDIVITGSLANFNWSKYSDIDLHIIFDFKEIDDNVELVRNYMDSSKSNWNMSHDNIKIMGFPIEIYVEDKKDNRISSGVYSLQKNEWISKPSSVPNIKLEKYTIKDKAARLMTKIDDLLDEADECGDDDYKLSIAYKRASLLFNKIKSIRKHGLEDKGEMSVGNIVFKVLRRTGYLDKLYNIKTDLYDRLSSITKL